MNFLFAKGNRELSFRLKGSRIESLALVNGYEAPVPGPDTAGNVKMENSILLDISSAITENWSINWKTGVLTAPKEAHTILSDGRFFFERTAIKFLKKSTTDSVG